MSLAMGCGDGRLRGFRRRGSSLLRGIRSWRRRARLTEIFFFDAEALHAGFEGGGFLVEEFGGAAFTADTAVCFRQDRPDMVCFCLFLYSSHILDGLEGFGGRGG